MNPLRVIGGRCAIVGGAMRIVAGFIPYTPGSAWLEGFYGLIDICLLLGLIGIFGTMANRLCRLGLAGLVVAVIGQASIIGPDPVIFEIDFYLAGSAILLIGLAILSMAMLRSGQIRGAAIGWLTSVGLAVLATLAGAELLIAPAGIAFGAGFVLAGRRALTGTFPASDTPRNRTGLAG